VALAGAGITVGLLLWWVPVFGYTGAAWAHLVCYVAMALISYLLGRRYYPVPYDLKRVLGYVLLGVGLYAAARLSSAGLGLPAVASGTPWLALFLLIVWLVDGRRLLRRGGGT
jgi:O-antigen/teichoic acid export membrane protein